MDKNHVIDHRLCPFTKSSDIRIVIWSGHSETTNNEQGQDMAGFLQDQVQQADTERDRAVQGTVSKAEREALEFNEKNSIAWYELALSHQFLQKYDKAEPYLKSALEISTPSCSVCLRNAVKARQKPSFFIPSIELFCPSPFTRESNVGRS